MKVYCPFCRKQLQFQFVGSHWRLICLNRDCEGYCYINGLNEEEILAKIKTKRRKEK